MLIHCRIEVSVSCCFTICIYWKNNNNQIFFSGRSYYHLVFRWLCYVRNFVMYKIVWFFFNLALKFLHINFKYTMTENKRNIMSLAASLSFIKDFKIVVFIQSRKQLKPLGKYFYILLIMDWRVWQRPDEISLNINNSDSFEVENKKKIKISTTWLSSDDACLCWQLQKKSW